MSRRNYECDSDWQRSVWRSSHAPRSFLRALDKDGALSSFTLSFSLFRKRSFPDTLYPAGALTRRIVFQTPCIR